MRHQEMYSVSPSRLSLDRSHVQQRQTSSPTTAKQKCSKEYRLPKHPHIHICSDQDNSLELEALEAFECSHLYCRLLLKQVARQRPLKLCSTRYASKALQQAHHFQPF